jgi:mRNA-degrading endonuclease RelE of RelBE toxin-antitoxin system
VSESSDYRFIVVRSAAKTLRRCPKAGQIMHWLDALCADPFAPDNNIKPLTGVADGYRRRFGDWRVSYRVDRAARIVEVFEVEPRGSAYR